MTKISYKKGGAEDVDDFLIFFKQSIKELFPQYSNNSYNYLVNVDYNPEWIAKQIKSNKKYFYLAVDKKKIVGYLLVTSTIAGVGFADWLAVDKSHQKLGVATKLLSMWETDSLNGGAHSLHLWTTKETSVDFYKNRGFSLSGKFPKAWYGHDTYLMYKILREPKEENFLRNS